MRIYNLSSTNGAKDYSAIAEETEKLYLHVSHINQRKISVCKPLYTGCQSCPYIAHHPPDLTLSISLTLVSSIC